MRSFTATALALLLAAPPVGSAPGTANGTVEGVVSLGGRPLSGFTLALVDLNSGSVFKAKSGSTGQFHLQVAPGEYTVTSQGASGLTVGRAPLRLFVGAGQTAIADVDLVALPMAQAPPATSAQPAALAPALPPSMPAEPPAGGLAAEGAEAGSIPQLVVLAPEGGAGIRMNKFECLVANEYPVMDAQIDPASSVARARVFFHPGTTQDWFFVEMVQLPEGGFQGKLPRPHLDASPISYYVQATTTGFVESQTEEVKAVVVADKVECGAALYAPFGAPGPVQVFSAATGSAITPAGFAAGGLLTAGAIALIAGGAAAVGIGTVIVTQPDPTPSPSPVPTPTPEPTPTPPTPSPSPSPSPEPSPQPPPCTTTPCPVP